MTSGMMVGSGDNDLAKYQIALSRISGSGCRIASLILPSGNLTTVDPIPLAVLIATGVEELVRSFPSAAYAEVRCSPLPDRICPGQTGRPPIPAFLRTLDGRRYLPFPR